MVNFGPPTAEIGWWVWVPQQISTRFASLLRYCTDFAQRKSTRLCTMFGRLLGCSGALYIHFWGLLPSRPLTEFCQAQNSLRPSLEFSYIDSVTARHSSSGCQPNCGVVEGTELRNFRSSSFSTEGATYILRAAITLGIGPHSSLYCIARVNDDMKTLWHAQWTCHITVC